MSYDLTYTLEEEEEMARVLAEEEAKQQDREAGMPDLHRAPGGKGLAWKKYIRDRQARELAAWKIMETQDEVPPTDDEDDYDFEGDEEELDPDEDDEVGAHTMPVTKAVKRPQLEEAEEAPAKRRKVIDLVEEKKPAPPKAPAPPKGKFRFNAKNLGITVPFQAHLDDMDKEDILEGLRLKLKQYWCPDTQYVVAEETHKDGNKHFHALLKFKTRCQASGNTFKVGTKTIVFNAKNVWNTEGWKRYISKEDEAVLTNMTGGLLAAKDETELFARASAMKGQFEALSKFTQLQAGWLALSRKKIDDYKPRFDIGTFAVPDGLGQELKMSLEEEMAAAKNYRRKVFIVVGPSQLGKTEMMRTLCHTLGGHTYHQGRFNLDLEARSTAPFMILDDMEEGQVGHKSTPPLKAFTQSHGYNMTAKYRPTMTIRPKTVVILTNDEPEWLYGDPERADYWSKNSLKYKITAKLF